MELWMPQERPSHNAVTGRFLKGHIPYNKGKKWDEWMSKRGQRKSRSKGCRNMVPGKRNVGGWNRRQCIAVTDDGQWYWFQSAADAERKTGIQARNINHVCHKKTKHAGGLRWFFEDDPEWRTLIR